MARRFYACAIAGLTVALGVTLSSGPASGEPDARASRPQARTVAVDAQEPLERLNRTTGSIRVNPGSAIPGDTVRLSGKIKKAKKRPVLIQVSTGGRYKTVLKTRTNRKGKFQARWTLPTYAPDAVPQRLRFRGKLKGKLNRRKVTTRTDYLPKDVDAAPASDDDQWHAFGNYLHDFTYDDRSPDGTWDTNEIHVWNPYTFHSTLNIESYVPADWAVSDVRWTSAGTLNEPLLVADTIVRVPGSGITPAHTERHLYVIDTSLDIAVNDILVDTASGIARIVGSDQGPVVAVELPTPGSESSSTTTRAYNVLTGAVLWERLGRVVAGTFRSVLVSTPVPVAESDFAPDGQCYTLAVVNTTSGALMRSIYTGDYQNAGADTCAYDVYSHEVWGLSIDPPTQLRWYEIEIGYTKGPRIPIDGWTGADAILPDNTGYADPFTNNVAEYLSSKLQVSDSTTGAVLFTPDPALGAEMLSLMHGKIYLTTADGSPVVEAATGRVLANAASTYPVLNVGPWVLWSDNTVSRWPYTVSP